VFRALREGEQADVLGSPGIELLHRPGEQSACDAALLELGTHGERAEEPDASPSGREVGADQLPIELRGERGDVGGALLAVDVVAIVPEILRTPMKVPKARRTMRAASGKSLSSSALTTGSLAFAPSAARDIIGRFPSVGLHFTKAAATRHRRHCRRAPWAGGRTMINVLALSAACRRPRGIIARRPHKISRTDSGG
jgi:hypothetical protein